MKPASNSPNPAMGTFAVTEKPYAIARRARLSFVRSPTMTSTAFLAMPCLSSSLRSTSRTMVATMGTMRCSSFSYCQALNHTVTVAGSSSPGSWLSSSDFACLSTDVLPVPQVPKTPMMDGPVVPMAPPATTLENGMSDNSSRRWLGTGSSSRRYSGSSSSRGFFWTWWPNTYPKNADDAKYSDWRSVRDRPRRHRCSDAVTVLLGLHAGVYLTSLCFSRGTYPLRSVFSVTQRESM